MTSSCHSEYGKIESIFIKPALAAFISDARLEQDWQPLNFLGKPDFNKALTEYAAFEKLLTDSGANINHFPTDLSLSIDSIYCRDAAIATDYGIILCNMGKPARKGESAAQGAAFAAAGIKILGAINQPGTIEGGDLAWLNSRTLAVGLSYRTNQAGIEQLKALLEPFSIEIITVDLPHYKGPADVFHLMSVLSPVDHNLAVVYSPLLPIRFRNQLLQLGFELVEVPDAEFESMGCNVLAIAPRVCIMVSGNPITKARLEKAGARVFEYEGEEISVKGGGGPTCLTRPLHRQLMQW